MLSLVLVLSSPASSTETFNRLVKKASPFRVARGPVSNQAWMVA